MYSAGTKRPLQQLSAVILPAGGVDALRVQLLGFSSYFGVLAAQAWVGSVGCRGPKLLATAPKQKPT